MNTNNEIFQMLLADIINNPVIINETNDDNNYNETYNSNINNNFINNIEFIINEINYNAHENFPMNSFYNNSFSEAQDILNNSLYERNPIRHVITEDVKNSLAPIKFVDVIDKESNNKCSITREPFTDDDDVIQLPCNHCFLVEPVMKWLTEESCECPICRYRFDSIEKNTRTDDDDGGFDEDGVEDDDMPELEPIQQIDTAYEENLLFSNLFQRFFYDENYNYIGPSNLDTSPDDISVD